MNKNHLITCSIVTYKNNFEVLSKAMNSFLNTSLNIKLYIIDNSPNDEIKSLCTDQRVEYIFNNKNIGFGAGHNIAIEKSIELNSDYHLVLNPDIFFTEGVIEKLVDFMEKNQDVGQVMPKILYPDGEIQYLCKLLPTPLNLIFRRFIPIKSIVSKMDRKYELRFSAYKHIMNTPYLSGCFMFFRSSTLKEIGLFDDRIFMYIEDCDLTRRIHKKYKTYFYPKVKVYHEFAKGSHKSFKLTLIGIHGAIMYFNKWGWIFDKERKAINKKVVSEVKELLK